jgi:shikimate kinase
MPPLQIVPEAPADLCADGFVAGTKQAFSVGNLSAFPSRAGLQLHWQVHNATGSAMANETFVIAALPAPGTRVELTVTATNSDGVTASGSLDFTVQSAKSGLAHELANLECRIRHIVDMVNRLPRLPIPENKAKREEVLVNIAVHAKDLAAQATELAKEARKVSAGKSK